MAETDLEFEVDVDVGDGDVDFLDGELGYVRSLISTETERGKQT